MPQIFEEHDGIVKEKTAEYQKALKLRRERFVEELEAYNHQVISGNMKNLFHLRNTHTRRNIPF